MQYLGYLLILVVLVWLSDVIGTATKARIPGAFMLSVFLLVGWWTVLPMDVLETSTVSVMGTFVISYIMVQIGTLFDPATVKKEWKTVVVALAALVGLFITTFGIGQFIVGKDIAIAATPTLAGGSMATLIINAATEEVGRTDVITVASLALSLQGFVGMPGAAFMLKKHGRILLEERRAGKAVTTDRQNVDVEQLLAEELEGTSEGKKKLIELIPLKYKSTNFYLMTLLFYAFLAMLLANWLKGMGFTIVTSSITGILIGITANILGLIDRDPQGKAQMTGLSNFVLMLAVLGGLRNATPQVVMSVAAPLTISIILATIGILVVSLAMSKVSAIGYNKWICMAIGLNCFLGFPPNYFVTIETINALTDDEDEKQYLNDEMMPKMILGSVITVSIVSVVVAGLMVPMLAGL